MKNLIITQDNAGEVTQQFNAEYLTTERAPIIGKGYEEIEIEENFYNNSIDEIVSLIGGHAKTMQKIRFRLRQGPLNHWSAKNFIWSQKRKCWTYCAGQDHPEEIRQIRKYLTN